MLMWGPGRCEYMGGTRGSGIAAIVDERGVRCVGGVCGMYLVRGVLVSLSFTNPVGTSGV